MDNNITNVFRSYIPNVCQSCKYFKCIIKDSNGMPKCTAKNCPHEQDQIEDTRDGQTYGDF